MKEIISYYIDEVQKGNADEQTWLSIYHTLEYGQSVSANVNLSGMVSLASRVMADCIKANRYSPLRGPLRDAIKSFRNESQ